MRIFLVVLFAWGIGFGVQAQVLAELEANVPKVEEGLYVPVSVNLDEITFLPDSALALVEKRGNGSVAVPFQIEQGEHRRLHWLITPLPGSTKRTFHLLRGHAPSNKNVIAERNNGALTIRSGGKNLLRYQYGTVYPPAGVDTAFRRSGFIHPLWSPHGQELTRIQPPDHYHHYGIWNPWTHVLYNKDTIDFWNIGGKKGTVRFAGFTSITNGPVFSSYEALHEHVVFKKDGGGEIALKELQTVRVYPLASDPDQYVADITIELHCAQDKPVLLLEYRYGGLGWRTTGQWDRHNSEVITSAGKSRKDADGSRAAWCIVQGKLDEDYGGVVMMSYPTNYNHPEPLRIWPEDQYNRGDMFANFSPTKDRDWLLEPGKKYVLKYRLLVYNGRLTAGKADRAWQYFAQPPQINIIGK